MTLPTDDFVKVTSIINPVVANSVSNFNVLTIVGSSTRLPTGQPGQEFTSLDEVGTVFEETDPEYLAAQEYYLQPVNGGTIQIARRYAAATPGELLGGQAPDTNLAHYTAIANGYLALSVDGAAEVLGPLNFAAAGNLSAVAAIIQTALDVVKVGSTVVWNGTQFIIRSGTTGAASAVAFPVAPGEGVDLSTMMGLTLATGAISTPGVVAETITQCLQRLDSLPLGIGYFLAFTAEATDQNLFDAGTWASANATQLVYTTMNAAALNIGDETNLGYLFAQAKYSWTLGLYHPTNPYAILAAVARATAVDFSGTNTVITLWGKTLTGVTPTPLTETQKAALKSYNLNYYSSQGSIAIFAPGTMGDGGWFDNRQNLDWLSALVATSVLNFTAGQPNKLPQTDTGMASLVQTIDVDMEQAVTNGTLAPGVWNGPPLANVVKTGQVLPKGYFVYAAPVASQSEATRTGRVAPPITILGVGAGAIQGVNITLNYQQ